MVESVELLNLVEETLQLTTTTTTDNHTDNINFDLTTTSTFDHQVPEREEEQGDEMETEVTESEIVGRMGEEEEEEEEEREEGEGEEPRLPTTTTTESTSKVKNLPSWSSVWSKYPKASQVTEEGWSILRRLVPSLHGKPILTVLSSHLQYLLIEKPNNLSTRVIELLPTLHWFATQFQPDTIVPDLPSVYQVGSRLDKLLEPMDWQTTTAIPLGMQLTRFYQILVTRAQLGNYLTPLHAIALKYAGHSQTYRSVLPLLQLDATTLKFSKNLSYQEFYQYFYYAGLVHIQLGDYEKAFQSLELVIFRPEKENSSSTHLPSIQQAALRKYLLVGLILNGKTPEVPPQFRSSNKEDAVPGIKAYQSTCNYFTTGNMRKFREIIAQPSFTTDGNRDLLDRCEAAFLRQAILRLPRFYCRVGLHDIEEILHPLPHPAIEELILSLTSQGRLAAELTDYQGAGRGMVRLEGTPRSLASIPTPTELAQFEKLLTDTRELDTLAETTQSLHQHVVLQHANAIKSARSHKATRPSYRMPNLRSEWI